MDDPMDRYIRHSLKNWAAQQRLPAEGRQRVLWLAASQQAGPARESRGGWQSRLRWWGWSISSGATRQFDSSRIWLYTFGVSPWRQVTL